MTKASCGQKRSFGQQIACEAPHASKFRVCVKAQATALRLQVAVNFPISFHPVWLVPYRQSDAEMEQLEEPVSEVPRPG